MENYDIDDLPCPKCGNAETHSRDCNECDDAHEECDCIDDICASLGHCIHGDGMIRCRDCAGTGIQRWCPKCGADYWQAKHLATKVVPA